MTLTRPDNIVAAASVREETSSYPGSDEVLCPSRALGAAAGLVKTGVHLEHLLPGTRTSWPHAHEDSEEWAFVLSGTPSLWLDGQLHDLAPFDLVAFPPGTGQCHTFVNNTEVEALLLVGGEKNRPDGRIFYPFHPQRKAALGEARWWPLVYQPKGDESAEPRR